MKERIQELLDEGVRQGIFPGAAAGIVHGPPDQRERIVLTTGATRCGQAPAITEQTCFDLASLTKPLATTLALLCLIKTHALRFSLTLHEVWGNAVPPDKRALTLRCLLGHSSGLPAHRPYYQQLGAVPREERKIRIREWLLSEPLIYPPGRQRLYSDLDFMLLGLIVEEAAGAGLDQVVAARVFDSLQLEEALFFRPLPAAAAGRTFAATEECPWRGRVLEGEVHDDNAHSLGGVAGHAGLFGTIGGVLALVEFLLEVRQGRKIHPHFRPADFKECLSRRHSISGSTLLLGFDSPSPAHSSAGRFFSPFSFGHLGFTGTSFWADPEQDLVVVLLTNRVHPHRRDERIKTFRPRFHDLVAGCLSR